MGKGKPIKFGDLNVNSLNNDYTDKKNGGRKFRKWTDDDIAEWHLSWYFVECVTGK